MQRVAPDPNRRLDIVSVSLKSPDDIAKMRVAGRLAAELLDYLAPHVVAGVTTRELDRIAHDNQVSVQHDVAGTRNNSHSADRLFSKN